MVYVWMCCSVIRLFKLCAMSFVSVSVDRKLNVWHADGVYKG